MTWGLAAHLRHEIDRLVPQVPKGRAMPFAADNGDSEQGAIDVADLREALASLKMPETQRIATVARYAAGGAAQPKTPTKPPISSRRPRPSFRRSSICTSRRRQLSRRRYGSGPAPNGESSSGCRPSTTQVSRRLGAVHDRQVLPQRMAPGPLPHSSRSARW